MTTPVEDRISQEDRISRLEGAYEHLATKADVAELRTDLKHIATKADVANFRAEMKEDMANLQVSLIKWMVGLVLGGMIGVTGLVLTVMGLMG